MRTRKEILEARIARLEKLFADCKSVKNEAKPTPWVSVFITKETAAAMARTVKEYLAGENARVRAKLIDPNTDGRAEVKVVLHGKECRYYFSGDLLGRYVVYTYDNGRLGDLIGKFDEFDEAAEAIADHAYGLY